MFRCYADPRATLPKALDAPKRCAAGASSRPSPAAWAHARRRTPVRGAVAVAPFGHPSLGPKPNLIGRRDKKPTHGAIPLVHWASNSHSLWTLGPPIRRRVS